MPKKRLQPDVASASSAICSNDLRKIADFPDSYRTKPQGVAAKTREKG
jgi:hypothetical protein